MKEEIVLLISSVLIMRHDDERVYCIHDGIAACTSLRQLELEVQCPQFCLSHEKKDD